MKRTKLSEVQTTVLYMVIHGYSSAKLLNGSVYLRSSCTYTSATSIGNLLFHSVAA
jgi:hypothetical protein